jgi:multicomponent Na+:H+ antiporter subunit G
MISGIMIWVIYCFLAIGVISQILGTIALHRFPDVYTRLHGSTKCTTFGSIFIYFGIILYGICLYLSEKGGYASLITHTFLILILLMITNPTGAHAIARAAYRSGVMPKYAVVDKLKERRK